jgi:flagellar basal-body rod modification protein FlgD
MTEPISSVVGTIDPSTAPANASSASSASNPDELDPQAFLQLLVAQLQYQDPTNPVNTSDFMNQTAMLSQVQTMDSLSSTLTSLATAQQSEQATAMIGRQVTYTGANGEPASGVVGSVQLLATGPLLQVGNTQIALSKITSVSAPTAPTNS